MKKILLTLLVLLPLVGVAQAEQKESVQPEISLAQASEAAGIGAGAQQRNAKAGIDFKQLERGLAGAYRQPPDEKHLNQAALSSDRLPLPSKDSTGVAETKAARAQSPNISHPVAESHDVDQRTAAPTERSPKLALDDKKGLAKASYDLGVVLAMDAKQQLKALDTAAYMRGFRDGYEHNYDSKKLAADYLVVSRYYTQERNKGAKERLLASAEFLAKNAQKPGVITTKSGLQYEVLAEGDAKGDKPKWNEQVTLAVVHSKPNGKPFYDSAALGVTETLAVTGAVPEGWTELFKMMRVGSRYRVYLSPALGYGEEGNGDLVLPNDILITEFTLLNILHAPPVVPE